MKTLGLMAVGNPTPLPLYSLSLSLSLSPLLPEGVVKEKWFWLLGMETAGRSRPRLPRPIPLQHRPFLPLPFPSSGWSVSPANALPAFRFWPHFSLLSHPVLFILSRCGCVSCLCVVVCAVFLLSSGVPLAAVPTFSAQRSQLEPGSAP